MKEAKIFLLDLDLESNIGKALQRILESFPNLKVQLKYESLEKIESTLCDNELSSAISRSNSDLIFIVLSMHQLEQSMALLQSISRELLDIPVIVAIDSCKPDEMFSLLKHGATDFITPPIKDIDILPRLWRLLESRQPKQSLTHKLKQRLGLKQLVGESPAFLEIIKKIPLVAKCDASVLISGEI